MNVKRSVGGRRSDGRREKIPRLEPTAAEEPRPFTVKAVLASHLRLLLNGKFSDVTFVVGEGKERISCHQLFLKARSPVFEVMFSDRWSEDAAKEVLLEDVNPKIFKMFLLFIYTDDLKPNATHMEMAVFETLELLKLAHKYDVQHLVSKCEELLESQVTLDHALDVFQAAGIYERTKLKEIAGALWAKSLSKLQAHKSFTQLDKETLLYILMRKDLDMKEVDIFRLAVQWAGNQKAATVEESLEDILPLIRFPTMTLNEFTTTVVPTKILPPSKVIKLFTYFGNDDKAKKSLARTLGFSTQYREPKDSTDYINIYAMDNESYTTRLKQFRYLKECLHFHESDQSVKQPDDLYIGLSGITFHCPAAASWKACPPPFKIFKICVKFTDCDNYEHNFCSNQYYTELLTLSSVQVEEGKTRDVKFDTVVPLKKRTLYCITIEEVTDGNEAIRLQGYNAQYFGPGPHELVTVKLRNRVPTSLAVQRNKLEGYGAGYERPNLICRLGFQEI